MTSFNIEGNQLASYLYFISGVVSVIYVVSVHQARARQRKNRRLPDNQQPLPDNDPQLADKQQSQSGMENSDLSQHGGSIPSSRQPEFKP